MTPHEAIVQWQQRQQQILMRSYAKAWQTGAQNYRSGTATPASVRGAGQQPTRPNGLAMQRALQPAFASLASTTAGALMVVPTAAGQTLQAAMIAYLAAQAYKLAGGTSVAWAGEQAGYAQSAAADGQLLRWQLDGAAKHCADCPALAALPPMPMDQWPTFPGEGATECNVGCFAPGVKVSGDFVAGMKARYRGEMLELVTASGARVTLTPNHPVATEQGFVAAASLVVGQKLLRCVDGKRTVGGVGSGAPTEHDDHGPAAIEKVFGALKELGDQTRTPARPEDLHGDGRFVEGKIEVVAADSELLLHIHAREAQMSREFALEHADGLVLPLEVMLREQCAVSDLAAASSVPSFAEMAFHRAAVVLERAPHHLMRVGHVSDLDSRPLKPASDSRSAHAEFLAELQDRAAGEVVLDELVEVRLVAAEWSGHVYDLQSSTGWLSANGIVCSNCKCSMVAAGVIAPPVLTGAQLHDLMRVAAKVPQLVTV